MDGVEPGSEGPVFVAEANLARRIKRERELIGWSPAKLAQQMTDVGYPLNQSAVWRIENGDPPRRVNLEEAVGFAKVFGITLEDLITPLGDAATPELKRLMQDLVDATRVLREADSVAYQAAEALEEYTNARPGQAHIIREIFLSALVSPDGHELLGVVPTSFLEGLGLDEMETRMDAVAVAMRHRIRKAGTASDQLLLGGKRGPRA